MNNYLGILVIIFNIVFFINMILRVKLKNQFTEEFVYEIKCLGLCSFLLFIRCLFDFFNINKYILWLYTFIFLAFAIYAIVYIANNLIQNYKKWKIMN